MSIESFEKWISSVKNESWLWFIKRLAANDTLATKSHQAGPYVPKSVMFKVFPSLKISSEDNPKKEFPCTIESHQSNEKIVNGFWYRKTKDECRITGWGGIKSPVLDPESTGSVCIFAFNKSTKGDSEYCKAWLTNFAEEEYLIEKFGPIEPGNPIFLEGGHLKVLQESTERNDCWLSETSMPDSWLKKFPTGADIVAKTVEMRPLKNKSPDERLISRRNCEYEIFRSIETLLVLPRVRQGFDSVDEFIEYGNSVSNRRKSRSGNSLELHLKEIFTEENISFSHGQISEGNKKPDFLFPSSEAYKKGRQPLTMLGAKTTCKDRWRQILNEADRIPQKHLVTLQQGISVNQHKEMTDAGVTLVVPKSLLKSYPIEIRDHLLDLNGFIRKVRSSFS